MRAKISPWISAFFPLAIVAVIPSAFGQDPSGVAVAPIAATPLGASLNINPKRVVIDKAARTATVYIFNQGDSAAVYDIGFIDRVMLSDGQIVHVDNPAVSDAPDNLFTKFVSAKPYALATPRRIMLEPGTGQTIRVRVAVPAEPSIPEYRTHLTVTAVPPREFGLTSDQATRSAPGTLSFRVSSILGISIPVIARTSPVEVTASFDNIRVSSHSAGDTVKSEIHFDLLRNGRNSLFGDIEIKASGSKEPIGMVRSLGVYTEIDCRHVKISLNRPVKTGEKLSLTFIDDDGSPGKIHAQASFVVP